MFKHVHHVHYVVHDRDAMVDYLEKNFGMKPDHLVSNELMGKEALYHIDKTHIEITQPLDPNSPLAQHLTRHGPGILHVAWAVDNIRAIAQTLAADGNKLRNREGEQGGITESPRGYLTCNIDPASSLGVRFQLAEGDIATVGTYARE